MPNSNSLFQLAQVVSNFPTHNQQTSSSPLPRLRSSDHHHNHQPSVPSSQSQYSALPPRKNACIVCAICFTCSKYYGGACQCSEIQPRRGKNLPQGGLDSRAKRLMPQDKDDYEFTINWLNEFANDIYRDTNRRIVHLDELMEVSLCKAHSSTLYRARKKYEKSKLPLSPADSTTTIHHHYSQHHHPGSSGNSHMEDIVMRDYHPPPPSVLATTTSQQHYPYSSPPSNPSSIIYDNATSNSNHVQVVRGGALAAKVRELSSQQQQQQQQQQQRGGRLYNHNKTISTNSDMLPDFTMLSASHSYKRKRTNSTAATTLNQPPNASISTPLLYSYHHHPQSTNTTSQQPYQHVLHHEPVQHQLPPLAQQINSPPPRPPQTLAPDTTSLSGTFQQSLYVSSTSTPPPTCSSSSTSLLQSINKPSPSDTPTPAQNTTLPSPSTYSNKKPSSSSSTPSSSNRVIETVSLKKITIHPNGNDVVYYVRNLAITDTYTFNDLLSEIDFVGPPPPGKRITISSDQQQTRVFPLSQAIRSVIPYSTSSHIDLYLGLADKTSIDWSQFK